jgi:hypothetical protein
MQTKTRKRPGDLFPLTTFVPGQDDRWLCVHCERGREVKVTYHKTRNSALTSFLRASFGKLTPWRLAHGIDADDRLANSSAFIWTPGSVRNLAFTVTFARHSSSKVPAAWLWNLFGEPTIVTAEVYAQFRLCRSLGKQQKEGRKITNAH